MAEPVGVTLGVLGVSGLISVCLDCYNFVQDGLSIGQNYAQFEANMSHQFVRLFAWAKACGYMSSRGPDARLSGEWECHVKMQLNCIALLFLDAQKLAGRYRVDDLASRSSIGSSVVGANSQFLEAGLNDALSNIRKTKKKAGLRGFFAFGLRDKKRCEETVQNLEKCLTALEFVAQNLDLFQLEKDIIRQEIETSTNLEALQSMVVAEPESDQASLISSAASRRIRLIGDAATVVSGSSSWGGERQTFVTAPSHLSRIEEDGQDGHLIGGAAAVASTVSNGWWLKLVTSEGSPRDGRDEDQIIRILRKRLASLIREEPLRDKSEESIQRHKDQINRVLRKWLASLTWEDPPSDEPEESIKRYENQINRTMGQLVASLTREDPPGDEPEESIQQYENQIIRTMGRLVASLARGGPFRDEPEESVQRHEDQIIRIMRKRLASLASEDPRDGQKETTQPDVDQNIRIMRELLKNGQKEEPVLHLDDRGWGDRLRSLKCRDKDRFDGFLIGQHDEKHSGCQKRIVKEARNFLRDDDLTWASMRLLETSPERTLTRITFEGPPQSVYQGGIFHAVMTFGTDYPWRPPNLRVLTKIYHPNINAAGEVCMDYLQGAEWKPALTTRSILVGLTSLLTDPCVDDPLVPEIAQTYVVDRGLYNHNARMVTANHATTSQSYPQFGVGPELFE